MKTPRSLPVPAFLVVTVFLLAGCADGPSPMPVEPDVEALAAEGLSLAQHPGAGQAERQSSDVYWFPEEPLVEVEGAVGQLVRTDGGVGYNLRTLELVPGHAISIWWVIFNNPEECDGDCGIEDLFVDYPVDLTPNPDVNPAVMSAGGHVVGGSGRAGFAGHLIEGQITTEHPAFLDGPGLTDARGAEIHLVVRSHGPLVPAEMPGLIHTFEGGCQVFLDAGVVPEEEGECADLQFAVFK